MPVDLGRVCEPHVGPGDLEREGPYICHVRACVYMTWPIEPTYRVILVSAGYAQASLSTLPPVYGVAEEIECRES